MRKFKQLIEEIDQTTSTNDKVRALVDYFGTAPALDVLWCIYLLSGKSSGRAVKTALLRQSAIHLSGLPPWLFEESYHIVGDLAETIALCLPNSDAASDYTLGETMSFLSRLAELDDEAKQQAIALRWMEMADDERFLFNKLITGNFRMGVSKQLVIRAVASYLGKENNEVAHRLMSTWHPITASMDELFAAVEKGKMSYEPYPFFLAYQLEGEPEKLGSVEEWFIERKLDGIRGQLIVRGGSLYVWSRGEELMTDKFPEFHALASLLPGGTVLDGEILPFKDGRPLPFAVMQTRIGRKNLSKKQLEAAPLAMVCYDLLEWQGRDIRSLTLHERKAKLESLLLGLPKEAPLLLSSLLHCASWKDVALERAVAREFLCEGVMIKRRDSVYETGRRRGNWWKWKVDPYTIDGVLLYAQRGHGRRANLYTDYTFAVWLGEELVPFAKAYSGLTDQEINQVDQWVKRHTLDKFGPVRSVVPELVFEIAFEGINASPRHKSGIALRFPRILRWRRDKLAKDANTKDDLLALLDRPAKSPH